MSMWPVPVVACDGCGWWEVQEGHREVLGSAPRRPGLWRGWWSLTGGVASRWHLCPLCAACPEVVDRLLAEHPVTEGPDIP